MWGQAAWYRPMQPSSFSSRPAALHPPTLPSHGASYRPTPRPRDPLLPEHIQSLVDRNLLQPADTNKPLDSYLPNALHTIGMLAYFGFLRPSDLVRVMVHTDTLQLHDSFMRVFIPCSKTDQAGQGTFVTIGCVPGSKYCPVSLVRDFLELAKYQRTAPAGVDCGPLLRAVRRVGAGWVFQEEMTGTSTQPIPLLSTDTVNGHWKRLAREAGIKAAITGQCGRIGGATAAAAGGASAAARLVHGRWLSETVGNGYVRAECTSLAKHMI